MVRSDSAAIAATGSGGNGYDSSRSAAGAGAAGATTMTGTAAIPSDDDDFKEHEEKLFMQKIDRKCASLQKKGLYYQAVELMEQGLISRKQLYGPTSIQVIEAAEKLGLLYNSLAMSSLYEGLPLLSPRNHVIMSDHICCDNDFRGLRFLVFTSA
jgi:hypothetical protein